MLARHPIRELGQVTLPVLTQCVCDGGHRLLVEPFKQVAWLGELIECLASIFFGCLGQVQIEQRGLQAAMPEKLLNPVE